MGKVSPMEMEGSQELQSYRDKNKKTVYVLGALIGVLVILTITFIALYASKDSCDDESKTSKNMNSPNGGNAGKNAVTKAPTTSPSTTSAPTTPPSTTPVISDDDAKKLLTLVLNGTADESITTLNTIDNGEMKVVLQVAEAGQLSQFLEKIGEGRLITALNSMSKEDLIDVLSKMDVDNLQIVLSDTRNIEVKSTLKNKGVEELGYALKNLPKEDLKKLKADLERKDKSSTVTSGTTAPATVATTTPGTLVSAAASSTLSTHVSATALTTTPDGPTTPAPTTASTGTPGAVVCQSEACKKTAKSILDKMNTTAKPCDDFMEYACGTFYKTAKIDADKTSRGAFDDAGDKNAALFQELLQGTLKHQSNISFEYKMKMFYNACLDEDAMEIHGLVDYTDALRNEWPTLNSTWDESSFDLQDVVDKYAAMFTPVFFYPGKRVDNRGNQPTYMLQTSHPYFLLDRTTLLSGRDSSKVKAYETYYKDFAIALGADSHTAENDANAFINLYRNIARISMDPVQETDTSLTYNPSTLGKMNNDYPYLDWVKVFHSMLWDATVDINSTQKVNVVDKHYFEQLGTILNNARNRRAIQNAFGFEQARHRVAEATKKMRQLWLNFRMVTQGVKEDSPRSEACAYNADSTFNVGMGKLLSGKRFSPKAEAFMDNLIDNLRKAYIESFENVNWMQNTTRQEALKKANEIEALIGIQSKDFDYTDIDKLYQNFRGEGDYNVNFLWNERQKQIQNWRKLNQVVDKAIWTSSMTVVNAFYDPELNEVVFPLGILQPPFFDQDKPSYMNYGGIGMVIGHEIGHGFDSEGRHYDDKGRIRDWWTPHDTMEYNKKAQCFIDQHNNLTMEIKGTEYHLDGKLTITEDIADHLGTVHAFRAYNMYSEKNKNNDWPLPGLKGLSDKALFFVALAQDWCSKATDELLSALLNLDTHSNDKYRVIGSLQNNKDFADAFKCKVGSYMNPAKKCTLW